ncbi:MAG: hypothetical protein LBJ15_18310 [Comamonas sp.]|jgi:hypothetical protein|uniref:hypothetical protein n=1 Tax=Comamonas sp. TaxID=34028 RepID=UPI00282BB42D|nr:hypothetical protein [Comamonas sp.]MDR0215931.1 hypothetical protein [Comamonas sp.]
MDAQITCIGVINADGHRVAPQPALVVHFAEVPGAMPLLDQALELRSWIRRWSCEFRPSAC